ncbi:MAG TPA: cyanophycin synthetase, partial [Longimicrobium sp.]
EGHAVLNADDPLVYAMRDRTGADIVLFSLLPPGENRLYDEHVERGGIGACIVDDVFMIRRGRLRIPIAGVREVPLTMGGAARFQNGNILAAIATAYVQGVRYDTIRAGLLSFFPSPSMTPGRLNMMRVGDARVLVDYAHNAAALEGLMDMVSNIPARRRIGLVTAPGDRRDEDIRTVGRLCATLDHAVIKEDEDARGRGHLEITELIAEGLVEGGMKPESIERVRNEHEALAHGLSMLGEGDLMVVLADDVPGVLARVQAQMEARAG